MNHISFFSGIGGFDLAAEKIGWANIAHCELDNFNRSILNYYWPKAISYEDIRTTDFTIHRGTIDVVTGGFPCQDASIAKQWGEGQKGLEGERTGLFFEYSRAIGEIQPKVIVFENIANILKTNRGKDFKRI
ncbi:MAG: DNA cytosine methyltransferase, partial [Flavobacterium sp.]|nr:DNA cytosine methyltransferase [Flavobacterium sp.]